MLRIVVGQEPNDFNLTVRQPGLAWINAEGLNIHAEAPPKTDFPAHWSACRDDLRRASDARCCFSGMYMRKSEVIPVEHAIPKNKRIDLAYEWDNYRYASSRINSRKGVKHILDPALLPPGIDVYHLDFVVGSIFPNPALKTLMPWLHFIAEYTASAEGLGLDDQLYRDERMEVWDDYLNSSKQGPEKLQLKKTNNFVWSEAVRQNLL
ncbi:hypothetical protein NDK50_06865 [Paraburkholderia bryophila]|uniref:hypothetical protein n=1 Tax=Paraburkholderia bryophila TaxID=420952 RepID=UPI002349CC61|nr:hypothetical protein [Paraburkholderia bryophila]WCM21169.1 hypothetical protein NDK50_06865 [Paraburkholderia bryophila]